MSACQEIRKKSAISPNHASISRLISLANPLQLLTNNFGPLVIKAGTRKIYAAVVSILERTGAYLNQ